jgi:calcineurin-like phosphoesterase family protein
MTMHPAPGCVDARTAGSIDQQPFGRRWTLAVRGINPMTPQSLFTADPHYGHARIIEHLKRPFSNVEAMNSEMIRRHNRRVEDAGGDEVDVYIVGDFAYKCHPRRIKEIFHALRGRLHLVPGNHDKKPTLQLPWASPPEMIRTVWVGKQPIVLCHYALRTWQGIRRHKALHFYGHNHGRLPPTDLSIDVGVDVFDFAPVSLDEILRKLKAMTKVTMATLDDFDDEEEE